MDRREGPGTHRGTEDSLEREETKGVSASLCEAWCTKCHQQLLSMPSSQRESEYQRDRSCTPDHLGLSRWERRPGLPRFKAHLSVSGPPPSLHGFRSFHDHDHPCPHHNASVITPTMTTSTVTTSVTVHSTTKLLSPTQFLSLVGSSYSESMHTAK